MVHLKQMDHKRLIHKFFLLIFQTVTKILFLCRLNNYFCSYLTYIIYYNHVILPSHVKRTL